MRFRLVAVVFAVALVAACRNWDEALANVADANVADASTDAGGRDAGPSTDAGQTDAGFDAGPPGFRLVTRFERGGNQDYPHLLPDGGALAVVLQSYELWRYAGGAWAKIFDNPAPGFDAIAGDPDTLAGVLEAPTSSSKNINIISQQATIATTQTCGYGAGVVGWRTIARSDDGEVWAAGSNFTICRWTADAGFEPMSAAGTASIEYVLLAPGKPPLFANGDGVFDLAGNQRPWPGSSSIQTVARGPDGRVYAATYNSDLISERPDGGFMQSSTPAPGYIFSMWGNTNGDLWVSGTYSFVGVRHADGNWETPSIPGNLDGGRWISITGRGDRIMLSGFEEDPQFYYGRSIIIEGRP